ncbi:MAG: hypothetical protein JST12_04930 [Armatimonadetes bacterium]|nr:hypothetical protein [Armatimonadota bacterium]
MRNYAVLTLAIVCLAGCGRPTLVGKWSATENGGTMTLDFTSNEMTMNMDSDALGQKFHMEMSGPYTYDGKNIHWTVDEINLPGDFKQLSAVLEQQKGKSSDIPAKIEGDKLTLSTTSSDAMLSKSSSGTFTRVK